MSRPHREAGWSPRRRLRLVVPLLAALLVAPSTACGAGDSAPIRDAGQSDLSLPDMGVVADLGPLEDQGPRDLGPYPTDADVLPADPVRFAPFLATAHAAFGPLQDDAPAPWTTCYAGPASCAAAPCALLSTCCVATGDCAELQLDDQLPGALLFTSCASGASALTCLAGQPLTPLGSSTPTVEAGGMRPGGDATQEGGVLVGQPVDLRVDRVELSVVFVPPVACSGNGCLESAGVSLARAEELSLGVVKAYDIVVAMTNGGPAVQPLARRRVARGGRPGARVVAAPRPQRDLHARAAPERHGARAPR